MPLLNDAKTCYVGTTPITTIMAGSVQVWPKGPPPPDGPFDRLTLYTGTQTNGNAGLFLSWETLNRPSTCSRGSVYTVQEDIHNDGPVIWNDFVIFNDPRGYNWMPLAYPNVMAVSLGAINLFESHTFRLKYETTPGVYEYSNQVVYTQNIPLPNLPTAYQQNECNGKPNP